MKWFSMFAFKKFNNKLSFLEIKCEFRHLKKLNHQNIVKVYELYIDQKQWKIYSIMEYVNGYEMFDALNRMGTYSGILLKYNFLKIIRDCSKELF